MPRRPTPYLSKLSAPPPTGFPHKINLGVTGLTGSTAHNGTSGASGYHGSSPIPSPNQTSQTSTKQRVYIDHNIQELT